MRSETERSNRLAGKVAIVTGAGEGIGRGCALMFARHGAKVIGVDLDGERLARTTEAAKSEGLELAALPGVDLTDPDATDAAFASVARENGAVHILVNAAAFAIFDWIETMSVADWRRTLAGELDIVFVPTRAAWPLLKAAGGASIINFASANARHALEGSPALAHCAGKGGVLAMTRQLAMEGAPHLIRANTISPGFIETAATRRHLDADPAFRETVLAKNMLKRLGRPSDIGWLAIYLGSDEAAYVTGADFPVDAGATAW